MRLFHSYWSEPLRLNCYDVAALRRLLGNVWYFSLSVAYAKAAGAEIVMHTDSLGAALLGHLPYDEVHLTLDAMAGDIHPRFWAAGKFAAQEAEPLGAVHIDGDVFVKRGELLRRLDEAPWDMLVQNVERYAGCYIPAGRQFAPIADVCAEVGCNTACDTGYCCGVIGFRDAELKAAYIEGYRRMAREFTARADEVLEHSCFMTPDIVAEQGWAYQLAQARGSEVACVLDSPTSAAANVAGFQHVLTSRKFDDIDKVKRVLRAKFPEVYAKTVKLCKDII